MCTWGSSRPMPQRTCEAVMASVVATALVVKPKASFQARQRSLEGERVSMGRLFGICRRIRNSRTATLGRGTSTVSSSVKELFVGARNVGTRNVGSQTTAPARTRPVSCRSQPAS